MRAREVATRTNTGILVMIDGKMVKIGAEELRAERKDLSALSANPGGEAT